MSRATLACWYNSRAWDEPESTLAFPDAAITFKSLRDWVESEVAENHPEVDASDVSWDAVQTFVDFRGYQPDIIHPADLAAIEDAITRAVGAWQDAQNWELAA